MVEFLLHTPGAGPHKGKEVEHLKSTPHEGQDVVFRVATDKDRAMYWREYALFKAPPAPVAVVALPAESVTAETPVVVPAEAVPPVKTKKKLFGR